MHFQRLRLSGFKSFVEPTDLTIDPGLTGVVGPNGCGKSNLLEALRWVMGANSAKAMRGAGMDDVIFAGASDRPARNHAEVSLTIDNAQRKAPHPFNDAPLIEVVRRIGRGDGSTYRVNGRETRARDVQLLFADASTGANSPALVRQGQISELIAARPQNRRRILEEAGGVSGLHGRRHEAELRLKAAETNLERLGDIAGELEQTLSRLKREARQAERFRKISADIRALQGALLLARYEEANVAAVAAKAELEAATREVEQTSAAAASGQTRALEAAEGLKPLKEEDAVAAAVLHRLTLERDRLDADARQARAEADRLQNEMRRIDADAEREQEAGQDATGELQRLGGELDRLRLELEQSPTRAPELEAWLAGSEERLAQAQMQVESLAAGVAAERARAEAFAAQLSDAEVRVAKRATAYNDARQQREALGPLENPALVPAREALRDSLERLNSAREALEAADQARAQASRDEVAARVALRQVEDRLGRLQTEARGLAALLTTTRREFPPALDQVRPARGFEAALAAALGDDLDAALDPRAPAHWGGARREAPVWPPGVTPLLEHVEAPEALQARLSWVGVIDRGGAGPLAQDLPVGARLVSAEGDLWRWDGFLSRAGAPRPAAVRLAQRGRLAELEAEIDELTPQVKAAQSAYKAANDGVRSAEERLRDARRAPAQAEALVAGARDEVERLTREQDRKQARVAALDESIIRLAEEHEQARAQLRAAREAAPSRADGLAEQELAAARSEAQAARTVAAEARAERDSDVRERSRRIQAVADVERAIADWTRRHSVSTIRLAALSGERAKAAAALTAAQEAPERLEAKRAGLLDAFASAERRRAAAADALSTAESGLSEAERESRAADHAAGGARERRAGLAARAEAADLRLDEVERNLRETAQLSPQELSRKLREDANAQPADAAGAESLLYGLERERDALGAVNLRAEEEAGEYQERLQTMRTERADLTGAIAKLRDAIDELNAEGRTRLLSAFEVINGHFKALFQALFDGGEAELRLIESDDPLEAGLEIFACPPGKRLATMSLMSGGEQALTAAALIFGVFLANPAPICVLDEVDAPLDDANVDRFCRMLNEMRRRTDTRFMVITHNPVTMARMDRLYGVTMAERGVSQLVSVDLRQAEALAAE